MPVITVPAISLDGGDDGVTFVSDGSRTAAKYTRRLAYRVIPGAGHNVPQEAPEAFDAAVIDVMKA